MKRISLASFALANALHQGIERVIAGFADSAGDAVYIRNLLHQLLVQLTQPEIKAIASFMDQAGSSLVPLELCRGVLAKNVI